MDRELPRQDEIWWHFKNKLYRIVAIAQHTETGEQLVVYIEYITAFIISSMLFNFTFWYEHKEQYELSQVTALGKSIILHGLPKSLPPI